MYKAAEFEYSVPYNGGAKEALSIARVSLLSLGFEITLDDETELHAEGPGMHSNQQPELMGVSTFRFRVDATQIYANATLGGVTRMKNFILYFLPGLLVFIVGINIPFTDSDVPWSFLLLIAPWLLIGPLLAKGLERGVIKAVERLVRGMAQARPDQ